MIAAFDEKETRAEIERLTGQLGAAGLEPRAREALEANLEILRNLAPMVRQNVADRSTLAAELDSLEDQLGLLLQRSIGATDAVAFSLEIDRVLARAEADAKSAEERERFVGVLPGPPDAAVLSENIKRGTLDRQESRRRRRKKKHKKRR
jgi:hypothetical protein